GSESTGGDGIAGSLCRLRSRGLPAEQRSTSTFPRQSGRTRWRAAAATRCPEGPARIPSENTTASASVSAGGGLTSLPFLVKLHSVRSAFSSRDDAPCERLGERNV